MNQLIALLCMPLALLLAAAPAPGASAAGDSTTPVLTVSDAWVRMPAPGADVTAAYLRARNPGERPLEVIGVESPVAEHAMLHETTVQAGQARMRQRDRLVIEPGATVALAPGGLHVMLHGLRRPLAVGERVELVLRLADGRAVSATAEVRPLGAH